MAKRQPRKLRADEISLIEALLHKAPTHLALAEGLNHLLVVDHDDGGMGSLTIARDRPPASATQISEVRFLDVDGVAVSATLNLDAEGELFELDVFKSDFTPLQGEFSLDRVSPE